MSKRINTGQSINIGELGQEELFHAIMDDVRSMYDYELTNAEAYEATHNLINFYRNILEAYEENNEDE